ncbi:NAD(+) synthase [Natronomonas sp.]|uniref:NAD(+) synthase n=1 Tax=Natronomonas sp. TaxID=2184060 RepID=UPI00261144BD|nr:NAD(+) synthase [Natronomonas sp.]
MTDSVASPPGFREDADALRAERVSFVRSVVADADADGVVLGLDSGLASTVAATIAVEALGPDRVTGLVLPSSKIGSRSAQDAETVADVLGVETETVHLQQLVVCFGELAPNTDLHGDPTVREALVDRLRMTMLYVAANATDRLVLGTNTRSDRLLGSFTEHGDGAADLHPFGDLYRTELETLAEALEIPSFVTDAPAATGFYPRRSDADGFDEPPAVIDAVLRRLVEAGERPDRIAEALAVDPETVERIARRHEATKRKRRDPALPGN